ncbi:hypothetical protein ACHWQZ_G019425 [Mnemiopsis leidyi]
MLEELDSWGPYQPQSILLDYELAIHNAVAEVYPSSTRRGCFFHHKKALFKHLRQADLLDEYLVPDSSRLLRERREPRAPKWVRYDEQLQRIVDAYDDYSNKMDYLKAIGNRTML